MALEEVIEANNQVVSLLASRQFYEALEVSSNAMDMFHQLGIADDRAEDEGRRGSTPSIDQCILIQGNPLAADEVTDEFIHRHAIRLPTSTVDNPSVLVTPVLIFNAALSHQLLAAAIYQPVLKQKLINKALRLYKLAYNGEAEGNKNTLFQLAILNNVGVIYRILGQEEEAKECFECLVSTMMMLSQLGFSEHQEHFSNFWANVAARSTACAA